MQSSTGGKPWPGWLAAALLWLAATSAAALDRQRKITQYAEDQWTIADGLPSNAVESIGQDDPGYLTIRTADGSVRFDGRTFTPAESSEALGLKKPVATLEDRDGNLWRASTGGLQRLPGTSPAGKEEFLPLAEGEASITALFEDREGSLWIGTARSGLFRLNDGDFLLWGMREGLSSSSARTVFQDHEGALWIGTDGGGLNRLFDGRVTHYSAADGLPRDVVLAVYESSPGTLWIGTAGGGLSRFEDGRFTTFSTADGLSSAAVTCLFADRQQSLWIGTAGGLNRMRRGQLETFTTGDGLSSDIIRALLQDREGDLWIGTDAGLNRFRNGQITSFSTRDGLASDQILALHEDRDGILWIGTDAGLSRRTETGFVSYTRRQSLFNEGLRQILDDREGRLWLCSNDGLLSLSKGSLEEVRAGSGRRPDAEPLLSARNLGCSGYNQPAAWQGEGGKLYFATDSGVLELTPEELVPPPAPPVVLERILLGNRPVPPDGALRLPAGSRDVEFHYTGLALFRAAQVRFRYRLEPFDGEWIDAGTRRSARYTNLPTGSFVFRVAASAGGPWSPDEAVVRFEVPKPWYRTQAALWVGLLLAMVLSRGSYQLRVQHLVRRNQRLARQVAESTEQVEAQRRELDRTNQRLAVANRRLGKANEELFELDQENTDFLTLAAHDLREPLVTLRGFAGELHSVMEIFKTAAKALPEAAQEQRRTVDEAVREDAAEALSFIDTSTERMDQLIHGLLTLSQLGRQKLYMEHLDVHGLVQEVLRNLGYRISRQGVEIELGELPPVVADRPSLKLVFENLLNNAILYLEPGRPGRIRISGEASADSCTYRIEDNGRGISAEDRPKIFQIFGRGQGSEVPGEGLGLAFVRTTLERHGGNIDFESTPGEGTTFFFSLPRAQPEDGRG